MIRGELDAFACLDGFGKLCYCGKEYEEADGGEDAPVYLSDWRTEEAADDVSYAECEGCVK